MHTPSEGHRAPLVSVIMPVFNAADVLATALESLLAQSLDDWELIACDDGSTDGSWRILQGWQRKHPDRVRAVKNDENRGVSYSLNRCVDLARGKFIARQDADDISHPQRFEAELEFLQAHDECGWVSCSVTVMRYDGQVLGVRRMKPRPTRTDLYRGNPFPHGAAMIRTAVVRAVGGYRVNWSARRCEDYDLWMRLVAAGYKGGNLCQPYYRFREGAQAYGRKTLAARLGEVVIRAKGYRALSAPPWAYAYAFRPLIAAMIPKTLLRRKHEAQLVRSDPAAGDFQP
jgi:glycosyltransferase EpsE